MNLRRPYANTFRIRAVLFSKNEYPLIYRSLKIAESAHFFLNCQFYFWACFSCVFPNWDRWEGVNVFSAVHNMNVLRPILTVPFSPLTKVFQLVCSELLALACVSQALDSRRRRRRRRAAGFRPSVSSSVINVTSVTYHTNGTSVCV